MIVFSEQLKNYRNKNKLSQEDLAKQLHVTRQSVSKWEAGESSPDVSSLVKIANIFNVSLDQLVLNRSSSNASNIDNTQFTFNPNKNRYVRKLGTMNFYEFFTRNWLAIVFIIAAVGIFLF